MQRELEGLRKVDGSELYFETKHNCTVPIMTRTEDPSRWQCAADARLRHCSDSARKVVPDVTATAAPAGPGRGRARYGPATSACPASRQGPGPAR